MYGLITPFLCIYNSLHNTLHLVALTAKNPLTSVGDTRAIHCSVLAWIIPWIEEPGGLQSMGSQRIGHSLVTKPPPHEVISVQFSSVAQSCPTLCDPMNRSTPGLPVHHQLPEFTQTHVHWVGDAIQPSQLSSPFPPAPNPSQHQSIFQWVISSHEVAKVLEFQL